MSSLMERARANGSTKPLSRNDNSKLEEELRAGSHSARKALVEGNMPLVTICVERFISRMPHIAFLRDDLLSEGMLWLVRAVDSLTHKKRPAKGNTTGYLSKAIQRRLSNFIDSEIVVTASSRTERRHRAKRKQAVDPTTVVLEKPKLLSDIDVSFAACKADSLAVLELQEEIEACCLDQIDVQIVRRAAMGHTQHEIGEALHLPQAGVFRRKNAIYERFLERTGMKRK